MSEGLTLIEAPADPLVTVAEAVAHLRQSSSVGSAEDTQIAAFVAAAESRIAAITGRAFVTAVWELSLPGWCVPIVLPLPPLQSVDAVRYYDAAGVERTLATSAYQVEKPGGPTAGHGRIFPTFGVSWPALEVGRRWPVTVRFTAGYGATAAATPAEIRLAVLRMVAAFYEQREDASEVRAVPVPHAAEVLIRPYWVRR